MGEQFVVDRAAECKFFDDLINCPEPNVVPPVVFVTGARGQGKTTVLKSVARHNKCCIWINCEESCKSRSIFEDIIRQMQPKDAKMKVLCENSVSFLAQLKKIMDTSLGGYAKKKTVKTPRFLIFDKVEYLKDKNPDLISFITELSQITKYNMCCIIISCLPWLHLQTSQRLKPPLTVTFSHYDKDAILNIIVSKHSGLAKNSEIYRGFAKIVVDIFQGACKNVSELGYLTEKLFDKYIEPVKDGKVRITETKKLYCMIESTLKRQLHKLYCRETPDSFLSVQRLPDAEYDEEPYIRDMPYSMKILALSAFLASHSLSGPNKKPPSSAKPRAIRRLSRSRMHKNNIMLLTPSEFSLTKLLLIFGNIVDRERVPAINEEIHVQIATLVSQGMISRISCYKNLDSMKFKCGFPLELAMKIGRSAGFDISHYIVDIGEA